MGRQPRKRTTPYTVFRGLDSLREAVDLLSTGRIGGGGAEPQPGRPESDGNAELHPRPEDESAGVPVGLGSCAYCAIAYPEGERAPQFRASWPNEWGGHTCNAARPDESVAGDSRAGDV